MKPYTKEQLLDRNGELVRISDTLLAERDALRQQLAVCREALELIQSYDKDSKFGEGICPYGCDCPDIAAKALAAIQPAEGKAS